MNTGEDNSIENIKDEEYAILKDLTQKLFKASRSDAPREKDTTEDNKLKD